MTQKNKKIKANINNKKPRQVNYEDIGIRLKEIRKQMGIKQNEMAQNLELKASYLCDIEAGKGNPGPDFFKKLASKYNINLHYLLMGTGDMFIQDEITRKVKPVEFNITDSVESIEEIVWLMEKSIYFKSMVIGACNKLLIEEGDIIRKSIKK
jgi:transcriptional regulator with XRE-family HTH domain